MDLEQYFVKAEFLIIVDRFSGYTWLERTSGVREGMSRQIIHAIQRQLGTGLHLVKKFRMDNAPNLNSTIMQEFCRKYGIHIENSASYHPGRNLLAEVTVKRVKTVIGGDTIENAMDEILALNLVPRPGHTLSPF